MQNESLTKGTNQEYDLSDLYFLQIQKFDLLIFILSEVNVVFLKLSRHHNSKILSKGYFKVKSIVRLRE